MQNNINRASIGKKRNISRKKMSASQRGAMGEKAFWQAHSYTFLAGFIDAPTIIDPHIVFYRGLKVKVKKGLSLSISN
jgi:hypothetical protein